MFHRLLELFRRRKKKIVHTSNGAFEVGSDEWYGKGDHEHEWEEVERKPASKCDLCGRTLRVKVVKRCKVCGREDYDYVRIEEPRSIWRATYHTGSAYADPRHYDLCQRCYKLVWDRVKEIENIIASKIGVYGYELPGKKREIVFHSVEDLVKWLQDYAEFASKPIQEDVVLGSTRVVGIGIHVKTKNPSDPVYLALIPWDVIVGELRKRVGCDGY